MIRLYKDAPTKIDLLKAARLVEAELNTASPDMQTLNKAALEALRGEKWSKAASLYKRIGLAGKTGNTAKIAKTRMLAKAMSERVKLYGAEHDTFTKQRENILTQTRKKKRKNAAGLTNDVPFYGKPDIKTFKERIETAVKTQLEAIKKDVASQEKRNIFKSKFETRDDIVKIFTLLRLGEPDVFNVHKYRAIYLEAQNRVATEAQKKRKEIEKAKNAERVE